MPACPACHPHNNDKIIKDNKITPKLNIKIKNKLRVLNVFGTAHKAIPFDECMLSLGFMLLLLCICCCVGDDDDDDVDDDDNDDNEEDEPLASCLPTTSETTCFIRMYCSW